MDYIVRHQVRRNAGGARHKLRGGLKSRLAMIRMSSFLDENRDKPERM